MLDHRPRRGLVTLAFSHIGGLLADEFTLEMERRGFNLTVHEHTSRVFAGDEVCVDMRIKGGPFEVMRALGVLRPQRLLRHERMRLLWEGRYLHKTTQAQVDGGTVPVLGVEPIGAHAVASLQTSSRTYIANGFVCHNTHWDPGRMNVQRMLDACTAALGVPPLTAVTPTAAPVGDLLWPILRTSTRGACPVHTRVVQQVCGATVDGDFYIATAQAVRGYQNAIGLPGNGVVGKETGTAIVKNVLRDLGYAPLVVDGNYDAATTAAVIQFQAASGIAADGFFEGQTTVALWYAMGQP
ncbi:MAG: peptidoglycan-binding protein [Acidimicrobiales bacterium]